MQDVVYSINAKGCFSSFNAHWRQGIGIEQWSATGGPWAKTGPPAIISGPWPQPDYFDSGWF